MRHTRDFEEFISGGIVKKQVSDKSRAEFLLKEAQQNYNHLIELIKKIPLKESNANNYIKNCYDILMETIRAKMLIKGFNASGFGAHEAEVSYFRILGFNEKDVQFLNQIRFFRNRMLYYGRILNKEYAKSVIIFTKKIYQKLKKTSNNISIK